MKPKIKVSEQVFKVYVANIKDKKWQEYFAHIVTIGNFKFNFIPFQKGGWQVVINVVETTSGCHVMDLNIDPLVFMECNTKEKTIEVFEKEAEMLAQYIKAFGKERLETRIAKKKVETFELCGPMPRIKEESL